MNLMYTHVTYFGHLFRRCKFGTPHVLANVVPT
jgi:hypothetical protein